MAATVVWVLLFFILHHLAVPDFAGRAQFVWHRDQSFSLNTTEAEAGKGMERDFSRPDLRLYPFQPEFDTLVNSTSNDGKLIAYLCFISFLNSTSYTLAICLDFVKDTSKTGNPTSVAALPWIANRDRPARGQIVSLTLQSDGNLVLRGDADPQPVWTSGTNSSVVRMELTMFHQNNGVDLCLLDSGGRTLWESRAHPADALTDAQFLRQGQELVSWASNTNPAPGSYSLAVEPAALILYVNLPTPLPYWMHSYCTSNAAIATNTTCLVLHAISFDYTGVNCAVDDYTSFEDHAFLYTCIDFASGVNPDVENRTVLRLFPDGNLRAYTLQFSTSSVIQRVILLDLFSENQCNLPLRCGPYGVCTGKSAPQCACPSTNSSLFLSVNPSDPTQGCALANPLDFSHCSPVNSTPAINTSNSSVQMIKIQGLDYFANAFSLTPFQITTEENCSTSCFHNCSCLAAFWRDHTQACFHAVDQIGSLQGSKNQSYTAYLKVNVSSLQIQSPLQNPHSNRKKIVIALVASAPVLLVAVSVFLIYFLHKRKRFMEYPTSDDVAEDMIFDSIPGLVPTTKFSFKELHAITNGFSDRLGKGGFGVVYAGTLPNGTKVAVKKLESARQGDKEFRSEIVIMGNIHHYNLLHLLGFCAKGLHRLLVYEYMENGSLDQWIFRKADEGVIRPPLRWDLRCKIALGAARGLAYLHHDCRERVLHLDIKPQNILLDKDFEAKVADFGLSRLMGRDKSSVVTTMRGTPGYLAPEWLRQGSIDVKCDVFSFGMVLMELVSGRKNLDHNVDNESQIYYPEWAFWEVILKSTEKSAFLDCLTDAKLDTQEHRNELLKIIMTAFLCVVDNPECRPSMAEVVQMLESFRPPVDVDYLATLHQEGSFMFLLSKNSFTSESNVSKRNDKPSRSSVGSSVSSSMQVSAR